MVKKYMYSTRFDLAQFPTEDLIPMMTCLLEKMMKANDQFTSRQRGHHFQAKYKPSIDVESYLKRILKYCPCTNECFLALLVYFDHMATSERPLRIDSFNIHRLTITGIMVASKFFSDVYYTNARYAKVGGLPVTELNQLELEFLAMNDYSLYISLEELQRYGDQLLMHYIREKKWGFNQIVLQQQKEGFQPRHLNSTPA